MPESAARTLCLKLGITSAAGDSLEDVKKKLKSHFEQIVAQIAPSRLEGGWKAKPKKINSHVQQYTIQHQGVSVDQSNDSFHFNQAFTQCKPRCYLFFLILVSDVQVLRTC